MAKKKDEEQGYYFKSGPTNYYDGTDSGADRTFLREGDYDALQGYKDQWSAAKKAGDQAGMDTAHAAAEALRAKYGYSGGANGGAYNVLDTGKPEAGGAGGGGYSYEDAPAYTGRYQQQIDALAQDILGRGPFSYDAERDPLFRQYKESYTREGERAMQDTLGQVSARTGGLASSYAGTAAQQSYNNYMGQLNDKIPELQQLAWSMYMDQGDQQRNNLDMLLGLDQRDYGQYRDSVGDWRDGRNFSYGVYSDARDRAYQAGRDAVGDQRYDREWAHQLDQEQYRRGEGKAALLAAAGDYSGYASLWGLSDQETARLVDEYARQRNLTEEQAARDLADWYAQYGDFSRLREQGVDTSFLSWQQGQAMGPSGGGGAGSGGSGDGGQDYDGLYAAAWASPNPQNFISSNYKKYGFTTAAGLADGFREWKGSEAYNGQKLYDKGDFDTLTAYVKKMQDAGRSASYMYDALKQQGYTDAVIDQVFAALGL